MQNNVGIYASQISGHLWAPNGSYDALATVTVSGSSVANIEFAGIPQGYKHLQLRMNVQNTSASNSSGWLVGNFNGDTTSNYSYHILSGSGSSAGAGGGSTSAPIFGDINNNGSGSSNFAPSIVDILDYASGSKNKTFRVLTGYDNNSWGEIYLVSGNWRSTSPITSMKLYVASYNIAVGSTIALYGVK